jgi:redox-sensitive bicupin YhaK (pirin superfamily)
MLELVIEARRKSLGALEVGRILPFMKRRMVGPFIFLDHIGPLALPPEVPRSADVRPHPHIGLSTVTYLFAGEIMHRDSLGVEQPIRPGAVNWMTAGQGITHSERFDAMRAAGGDLHGLQAWVALPEAAEEDAPGFTHYGAEELPVLEEGGLKGRLIAGAAYGLRSKVRTHCPSSICIWSSPRAPASLCPQLTQSAPPTSSAAPWSSRAAPMARGRCWSSRPRPSRC